MSDEELIARTRAGLLELRSFLAGLSEEDVHVGVTPEWTVSAILAHLAFWDAWVEMRWSRYEQIAAFDDLPDIAELINTAATATWRAIPPAQAVDLCIDAATSLTARIERLPVSAVKAAVATHRTWMVDRSRHWNPHLLEIRAAIDGTVPGGGANDSSTG